MNILDHGYLPGLTDDDHTQYLLANGTRALSANWNAANTAQFTQLGIGAAADNADFAALNLKNTDDPLTTEVGQSVSINAYLRKTINSGGAYTDELAAQIVFGKDADFFHASDETDCDGNIQFKVATDGTLGEVMRLCSGGNVGIGIAAATAPAGRLEIAKAATYQEILLSNYSDTPGDRNYLEFRRSNSDTLGTLSHTHHDDYIAEISFQGVKSDNSAFVAGAKIIAQIAGDTGATYCGTNLFFVTGTNAAAPATRLAIAAVGQITVGNPDTADAVPLLRVWKATAGAVDSPANTLLTLETDGTGYAAILAPTAAGLRFGRVAANEAGGLDYVHANDILRLRAGGGDYFAVKTGRAIFDTTTIAAAATNVAAFDIIQNSATDDIPVLHLRQDDNDEPFIHFKSATATAASGRSLVDKDGIVTLGAVLGVLMIGIDDTNNQITDGDYYVPFYSPTFVCHPL